MDAKRVNELGREIDRLLRLKTNSLGIKLFEKESDIPKDFQRLNKRKSLCMVIGYARFLEIPIVLTRDTYASCWPSDVSLGWGELPKDVGEKAKGYVAATAESCEKAFSGFMSLEGKYDAVGVCPLDRITLVPDIVQIWGSPLQLMMMEYANTWNGWEKIKLETNGHGASCYEVLTVPFLTKEVRFALADNGDRRHGMARDEDMIMGFPVELLEGLTDGLRAQQGDMNALPIMYDFDAIPFPVSRETLSRRFEKYC
ncbi:MAG: DUF169 domain-containing protein [Spirochaetales bacterium]|nr:DUF169 domain-containing protein [Spirochaetales bacterium]